VAGPGYYNRARNLKKAARQIATQFGGSFPDTYEGIRSLCGVGDYTAGAVASIAFGIPVPAVDGNVLRVVARITGDDTDIAAPAAKRKFSDLLRDVMPVKNPGDFNQALMELGATVCLPNGAPDCLKCPAAKFCRANLEGKTGQIPVRSPKKARRIEHRTVFLIFRDGKVALRRRGGKGLLAGLWEYPNEPDAGPEELLMKWGVTPEAWEFWGTGRHIFTHIEWHMDCIVVLAASEILPPGWVWADRAELTGTYALPNAFQNFRHPVDAFVK
jgi:A/G-specific adenine glycosylase